MNILESLNVAQREAAIHIDNALLILAGAGSGKTKTLTTRLAYLLSIGIPPQNTLTLTFTNKAATEMRERALKLIESMNIPITCTPLLCTFHKFGLLFLQRYMHLLSRKSVFSVIDEDDKRKIIRLIKKNIKNITKDLTPSIISETISYYKNNIILLGDIRQNTSMIDMQIAIIYQKYEEYLQKNHLIDFDDLLLLPYRILYDNETIRTQISSKYQYIMVDEYQDTNNLQANLLKLLCAKHDNLCVVGDDDQSIYSWRGANIENILNFDTQFNNTRIIKLEKNYRSTEQILVIANNLITHNAIRHNKTLKATRQNGKKVQYIKNYNDKAEMKQIIESIRVLVSQGDSYNDIAILFRLNALARNIEECFNRAKIPFKMIGVIRFYDRQEIKDVLAYLRLALNLDDNFSLDRIINQPKRGIGEKTFADILEASMHYTSIYAAWKQGVLSSLKCYARLNEFFTLIESLRECLHLNPSEIPTFFKTKIKLYADDIPTKDFEINEDRRKNMDELFASLLNFIEYEKNGDYSSNEEVLQAFLNDVTLSSSSDIAKDSNNVLCMSVHNSKGLEFKHVFVIGMEQGLFPLMNFYEMNIATIDKSTQNLNEERRLAYVAFTRAKDTLTLSYAKERMYNGKYREFEPSQFLVESGVVSHLNARLNGDKSGEKNDRCVMGLKHGDCVRHKIFGFGRIESVRELNENSTAMVNFGGTKRNILISFLTKL